MKNDLISRSTMIKRINAVLSDLVLQGKMSSYEVYDTIIAIIDVEPTIYAVEIQELEDHVRDLTKKIEQLRMENARPSIMLTSAQSAAKTWKRRAEAIQRDFGEFAARINTGEDIMGCEYCKKNYAEGECNCNCLKDFEWRGVKEE